MAANTCSAKHVTIALVLLRNNADVNARTDMGCTPIYIAAQSGNDEVLTSMLEEEAQSRDTTIDINIPKNGGVTPLMIAAKKGNLDVVKTLVNRGRDLHLDKSMQGGSNAVHIAARFE